MQWDNIPRDEQETLINIDYFDRTISLYTSRYSVHNRLSKVLGEPTEMDTRDGKICSVTYRFKLTDPKSKYLLHRSLIIGGFSQETDQDSINTQAD